MSEIQLPALLMHPDYILPNSKRNFGICGLVNFRRDCFDGARFIDVNGQEWVIESVDSAGYTNWFQRFWWSDDYKAIRVTFRLRRGHAYTFEDIKSEIQEFLMSNRLRGQPFLNKSVEVPKYLARFKSTEELVIGFGYFDARKKC